MPYEPLHDSVADDVGVDDAAAVCRYMDLAGLAVLLTTGWLKLTPISELRAHRVRCVPQPCRVPRCAAHDRVPVSQSLAMKSSAFAHENEIRVISKEGWHKLIAAATRQTTSEFPLQPFTHMATTKLRIIDLSVGILDDSVRLRSSGRHASGSRR